MLQVISRIFGSKNDRELKRMHKVVQQINNLEASLEDLSDTAIQSGAISSGSGWKRVNP